MDILAESHWALVHPLRSMSKKSYRILVFVVLWLGFGSTYLLKKPLGVIKSDIAEDLHLSKFELGMLDTALLLPYAVMQVFLGPLADHQGPRKTMACCLFSAGLSMAFFGLANSFHFSLLMLFLCGTCLAPTWPACSKCLASYFDKQRDTIFGIFSTAGSVGGICGTGLAVWTLSVYGWQLSYLIPSSFSILMSLLTLGLVYSPEEMGQGPARPSSSSSSQIIVARKKTSTIKSWLSLWAIPLIPEITLAVFTLKVVRYCMYMWLPLFLLDYLNYDKVQAGLMSTAFEVGGGMGSALVGFLTPRLFAGRSLPTLCLLTILSSLSLLLFAVTAQFGAAINIICLVLAGATNAGPDSLLSGSIPARLGERNGLGAGAALTGLVNGAGSVGTVIEGPIIGLVAHRWGWMGVLLLMVVLSSLGAVALLRAALSDSSQASSNDDDDDEPTSRPV
ncbi:glucose-6-phosphate exchanger SLC37A2-like [Daphnia pulicaria]|uniref:glucose-6-phosphate exchanger SLC37A2-like n=1 Tax=Daphnia pulicaria TaxID=35523 RepID=UPI001EEAA85D|nr:glucose-6-phosphate exchanger SLC37A2-like [Daphnia pulicaria]